MDEQENVLCEGSKQQRVLVLTLMVSLLYPFLFFLLVSSSPSSPIPTHPDPPTLSLSLCLCLCLCLIVQPYLENNGIVVMSRPNSNRVILRRPTPITPTVTHLPTPNVVYASAPSTPSSSLSPSPIPFRAPSGPSCTVTKDTSEGSPRYQIEIVNSSSATRGGKTGKGRKTGKTRKTRKTGKTRKGRKGACDKKFMRKK